MKMLEMAAILTLILLVALDWEPALTLGMLIFTFCLFFWLFSALLRYFRG